MKTFTTVVCVLGAIGGFGWCALAFANAQGAVHEVEGLIGALIGVCGVGFAGVIQGQK
jgi:membrane associated rhomboid family serine protease